MTAKEFVQSIYPSARSERHKENGGKSYYLIRIGGQQMWFSEGDTESKAWKSAKEIIEDKLNK